MTRRFSPLRLTAITLGLMMLQTLGGCGTLGQSSKVAFTNVTDTWVNVRFYVGTRTDAESQTPTPTPASIAKFVSDSQLQVEPGATGKFSLRKSPNYTPDGECIVHIQVEPASPSWQPTGRQYWLELLSPPPVNIVATGSADDMSFNTGVGAVALIPETELEEGRFEHTIVTVTETGAPE